MISGGCRCGAVRYAVAALGPPKIYCCHCRDCQTWSGSAFTQQALVPASAIRATGPVTDYAMAREDGATSTQYLCATCHARLWNINSRWPMLAVVRAGTLDESDGLSPALHIWTARKQPWIVIADDVPRFTENAPPAQMMALMNAETDE